MALGVATAIAAIGLLTIRLKAFGLGSVVTASGAVAMISITAILAMEAITAILAMKTLLVVLSVLVVLPMLATTLVMMALLVVARPALIRLAAFHLTRSLAGTPGNIRLIAQAHILLAVIVREVVATLIEGLCILTEPLRVAIHAVLALLLHLLLAIGHDDAIVVLGMLKIVLREHRIAGGLSVTSQRKILRGNVGRRSPHFYVGAVRLKAARQRIVASAIIIVITPAATTMLLSLPHALPFSLSSCNSTHLFPA